MLSDRAIRLVFNSSIVAALGCGGLILNAGVALAADNSCKARNLKVTAALRADIAAAHKKVDTNQPDSGPTKVYYGHCGSRYWALGTFKDPQLGTTDQPEAFSRQPDQPWKDLGDTGGDLSKIPAPLLKVWHVVSVVNH